MRSTTYLFAALLGLGLWSSANAQEFIEPGESVCQVTADAAELVVRARAQGLPPLAASAMVVRRLATPRYPASALWPVAFQVYVEAPAEATPEQTRSAVLQACLHGKDVDAPTPP